MTNLETSLSSVIQHLSQGGIIAYPTETIWGLGADIRFPEGLARINQIKGRVPQKATSVLVSGVEMAREYAELTAETENFLHLFWPGPLTMVLPAKSSVPAELLAADGTVGLRCSSHPWVRELLLEYPYAITTTSANRSGEPPAKSLEELHWLPNEVVKIHWQENCGVGEASTVVKPTQDPHHFKVLRSGLLKPQVLKRLTELAGLSIILEIDD